MIERNRCFANLTAGYLFPEVARRSKTYAASHPDAKLISLSIGNTTEPLERHISNAMSDYARALATPEGYSGYGDEQGLFELRKKIAETFYEGIAEADEVFISDGAKCDIARIQLLFGRGVRVAVQDPAYPVYVDGSVLIGAAGAPRNGAYEGISYLPCTPENNFFPDLTKVRDNSIIYFCSPNNPTGAVFSRTHLKAWVDYANKTDAIILFDAAYEAFIEDAEIPHSIFEVEGAKTCAIEICSLSKTAGFTGTRFGYTVIPQELMRGGLSLNAMWVRNRTTKTNGVSYILQKGAAAVFTEEGQREIHENIRVYKKNAAHLMAALDTLGIWYCGGKNAPYIWMQCPKNMGSWAFFDYLLHEIQVIGTPGEGFGSAGEGYFRFSTFGSPEDTEEAARRLVALLGK